MGNKKTYLDGAANTPLDKNVRKAMRPYLSPSFVGNSMAAHDHGIAASIAVGTARCKIAMAVGVDPGDVFFTSGATESNNWVIKSVAQRILEEKNEQVIICSATEHASVLNCCKQVEEWGVRVIYVTPANKIRLDLSDLTPYLSQKIALVCVMATNNETGVFNRVNYITKTLKKLQIPSLVDCTQYVSMGGENLHLAERFPYATFMTFSGHKIYGPTGTGCLITRSPSLLKPLIVGGGQERGLRGGTTNVAGVVGLGGAVELLRNNTRLVDHYSKLAVYLVKKIKTLPNAKNIVCNVIPNQDNIWSINFSGVVNKQHLATDFALRRISVSAGSACDSQHDDIKGEFNPSHVLLVRGLKEREIRNTVRVSFTKYTTYKDIDNFIKAAKEIINEEKQFIKNSSNFRSR